MTIYISEPDPVRYMDLQEFVDVGFLQEANRQFFHPLGLALEVSCSDPDGRYDTLRVWDCRDDPEGVVFGDGMLDLDKRRRVTLEDARHVEARIRMFGSPIQPVPVEIRPEPDWGDNLISAVYGPHTAECDFPCTVDHNRPDK